MKPNWLKCETCLWWERKKYENATFGHCRHSSMNISDTVETDQEYSCDNWTCARCWQSWDEYFFPKDAEGLITDPQIYIDHDRCEEVEFG